VDHLLLFFFGAFQTTPSKSVVNVTTEALLQDVETCLALKSGTVSELDCEKCGHIGSVELWSEKRLKSMENLEVYQDQEAKKKAGCG
jgi:hypothetical protein